MKKKISYTWEVELNCLLWRSCYFTSHSTESGNNSVRHA